MAATGGAAASGDVDVDVDGDGDGDGDRGCPVCLRPGPAPSLPFARGPCGHVLCRPCAERVLLTFPAGSGSSASAPARARGEQNRRRGAGTGTGTGFGPSEDYEELEEAAEEMIWSAPTRGRCPLCRAGMSLFDMTIVRDGADGDGHGHGDGDGDERGPTMMCPRDFDVGRSPLAGSVFAMDGRVGFASYHFPPFDDDGDGIDSDSDSDSDGDGRRERDAEGRPLPYVSYSDISGVAAAGWKFDDGSPLPDRVHFAPGCHWHDRSRTFHGTLDWGRGRGRPGAGTGTNETTRDGAPEWEVVVQFSSDLRYVSGGVIVKRRRAPPPTAGANPFPLDGRYAVVWDRPREEKEEGEEETPRASAAIEVVAHAFDLWGLRCVLDARSDPGRVQFSWPPRMRGDGDDGGGSPPAVAEAETRQWSVEGWDPTERPGGPDVGGRIVWETDDASYTRITWTRETLGGRPPTRVEHFGPRGDFFYRRVRLGPTPDCDSDASLPKYHPDGVWGNVFVQGMKVGLASYHFVSERGKGEGGAYVSYENPLCSLWPPLDDGRPVLPRVPFSDISWHGPSRTFRGAIDWEGTFGTSWQGAGRWRYEMTFDSEFLCVVGGRVFSSPAAGGGDEREWSRFGERLVYLNAASVDRFRAALEPNGRGVDDAGGGSGQSSPLSEANTSTSGSEDGQSRATALLRAEDERFLQVARGLRDRLVGEGASTITVAMLSQLMRKSRRGRDGEMQENPIDFNL